MAVDKSIYDGMDQLAAGLTTPEQEEKLRRASLNRQRILAVGDALRNIGNIYNTVHYAPSQQFNSPVEMERKFYREDKAQRDAVNQRYMAYKAQRDALDQRAALAAASNELKSNQLQKQLRELDIREFTARSMDWYRHATVDQKNWYNENIALPLAQGRITTMEAQARLNNVKADAGGFSHGGGGGVGGYTTTTETTNTYDENGKKTGSKTVRKREGTGRGNAGSNSGGGSLLPQNPAGGGTLLPKK